METSRDINYAAIRRELIEQAITEAEAAIRAVRGAVDAHDAEAFLEACGTLQRACDTIMLRRHWVAE